MFPIQFFLAFAKTKDSQCASFCIDLLYYMSSAVSIHLDCGSPFFKNTKPSLTKTNLGTCLRTSALALFVPLLAPPPFLVQVFS